MEKHLSDEGWCNTSAFAVVARIGDGSSAQIITSLTVEMVSMPFVTRSARSEINWLKDLATRQQQQEIEASKQAKPKL